MSTIEVKVPVLPESVADATLATWHKQPGDFVERDENIVDLETDKVMLEVPAPESGVLGDFAQSEGATVVSDDLLVIIDTSASGPSEPANNNQQKTAPKAAEKNGPSKAEQADTAVATSEAPAEAAKAGSSDAPMSPTVRRLLDENNLSPSAVQATGKSGRIVKEDVERALAQGSQATQSASAAMPTGARPEKRVPMTRLRARIAERLLEAQHSTAMLTTFNEVDLSAVMSLRKRYQETFVKQHGVKLGFMSFFTKASAEALKKFPAVNASIDGSDIVYHGYYDVGIAVSTERGLVVPVLRNSDMLGMADIEKAIIEYAGRAREGKLSLEEMTGGTFTITNGGIFGSMLSTPIVNPPQSAILGMHAIQERAVVVDGEIKVRPMMYIALSYDHRIVDGRESVQFLKMIKELLEDPSRLLLDI